MQGNDKGWTVRSELIFYHYHLSIVLDGHIVTVFQLEYYILVGTITSHIFYLLHTLGGNNFHYSWQAQVQTHNSLGPNKANEGQQRPTKTNKGQ